MQILNFVHLCIVCVTGWLGMQLLQSSSEAETPEDFACDRCKSKGTTTMKRVLVKLPQVRSTRVAWRFYAMHQIH
jgi:hypothetical protein